MLYIHLYIKDAIKYVCYPVFAIFTQFLDYLDILNHNYKKLAFYNAIALLFQKQSLKLSKNND